MGTQITDPLGKPCLYTYDRATGDLATTTYPEIATPARYTYDAHL